MKNMKQFIKDGLKKLAKNLRQIHPLFHLCKARDFEWFDGYAVCTLCDRKWERESLSVDGRFYYDILNKYKGKKNE